MSVDRVITVWWDRQVNAWCGGDGTRTVKLKTKAGLQAACAEAAVRFGVTEDAVVGAS